MVAERREPLVQQRNAHIAAPTGSAQVSSRRQAAGWYVVEVVEQ
jgi:hypothetical protein